MQPQAATAPPLGRIQRVDGPSLHLVVLSLYDHRSGRRVLVYSSVSRTTQWTAQRPKGEPADGFVRRLRKLLVGGTVECVEARGGRTRIGIQLRERRVWLTDVDGAPVIRQDDGQPVAGRRRFAQKTFELGWVASEPQDNLMGATTSPAIDPDRVRRNALRSRLVAHRKRLDKKLLAIERDAKRADRVAELRLEAELITAHLHAWTGTDSLTVVDWTLEPPTERTIAIDLRLGARGQADKHFAQARRFQRGAAIAAGRGREARKERDQILALLASLDASEVDAVEAAIGELGVRTKQPPPGKKRTQARAPHRTFMSGNHPIWVGKGPADNDTLTLAAKPHFHWLHARGRRGAHVVVPLPKGREIGSDLLLDAATLAAHFSGARTDAQVEVQHTARRHVRKARNAAPGLVLVMREKVLLVRMQRDRLDRLLSSERR